jgi:hypothetical protein
VAYVARAWRDEVRIAGALAEIRTEQLRNTSLEQARNFPLCGPTPGRPNNGLANGLKSVLWLVVQTY